MEMIRRLNSLFLGLVIVFIELATPAQDSTCFKGTIPVFMQDTSKWADSVLNSLSIEEKIAQLIIVPAYPYKDSTHSNHIFELIKKYNLGGVIFFKGGPYSTVCLLNKLQAAAKTPLFMGIDGEWGLAMRMDSTLSYPRQMMLGALQDDNLIYLMGCDISSQLHRTGFHTNFSPCVDINLTSQNPVINSRSFGEDKNLVARKSKAYMLGLQDHHILPVIKHFPGHGDTENDSHFTLPLIPHNYQHLDSVELYPFKQLIIDGVSGVMIAHLNVPAIDSSNCPSTLSHKIVNDLLRDSMKFGGLIFTDAMSMKGIKEYGSQSNIVLRAFTAGNDVLLMPDDVPRAINTLKLALDSNLISKNEIDKRCRKVLLAKQWAGLNQYKQVDTFNLFSDLHKPSYEVLQRKLIESAITVVKNNNNILPLKRLDTLKIACLSIGWPTSSPFQRTLSLYSDIDSFAIDKNANDSAFTDLYRKLKGYNLIIAGILNTDMRLIKNYGINDKSIAFLKNLADSNHVILNLFANPYVMHKFDSGENFSAIVISYEDKELNQDLSAQLLFGGLTAQGKLSVKASEQYGFNTGKQWNIPIRLKYTIPEELGINSSLLKPIDSLVNDAIHKKALPGCVVYLAKDGKVFFNKSYGYFTYDSSRAVKPSDIYDLASLTKISSTLPVIMNLYENDKIDMNAKCSEYIPELKSTNKKKIRIKEVLSHQARLQEWYPFFLKTIQCKNNNDPLLSKQPASLNFYKINSSQYINCKTKYIDSIYSKSVSSEYSLKVADSLYIRNSWKDSIYNYIYQSNLYAKPKYRYSDFGFILLSKAIENITHKTLDDLTDSLFYKPLGANSLCYNPVNKFDKNNIAPTMDDQIFRKQIVQGTVHDPAAAMLGGVSGHAGLFGSANDLGKLMQMYLNNGEYGGQQFFNRQTIELFNTRYFAKTGNRRALGFDKPEPDSSKISPVSRYASDLSFGHTGYTGTMVWVDPQVNLVYIFLSNRTYPDDTENKLAEMNLRTNIQEVVYKAIHLSNK
jgi:beta-N-acetylhexosaminidase